MTDARVTREHRLRAAEAVLGREMATTYDGDLHAWVDDGQERGPYGDFTRCAQLVANAERDIRAAIVTRLRAISQRTHDDVTLLDLRLLLLDLEDNDAR